MSVRTPSPPVIESKPFRCGRPDHRCPFDGGACFKEWRCLLYSSENERKLGYPIALSRAEIEQILAALTEAVGWIADTVADYNGWDLNGPADRAAVEQAITTIKAKL